MTVTVSVFFSEKNSKYWKIHRNSTQLRLKTLINKDFLLNGFQISHE